MNQSNENHLRETEAILRDFPETRDNDLLLSLKVWRKFHLQEFENLAKAMRVLDDDEYLLSAFELLPQIDSIKRYRRTLRDKYPSSKEAEEKRRKEEEESKHFYAANGQGMMFPSNVLEKPVTISTQKLTGYIPQYES